MSFLLRRKGTRVTFLSYFRFHENGISTKSSKIITTQSVRQISSENLTVELTTKSKLSKMPAQSDLKFGTTFSDHMLICQYKKGDGWDDPKIVPYGNLKLDPAVSSLHYGLQCFEGMKAYKSLYSSSSDILLFRPDLNMHRLSSSMSRLEMNAPFDHSSLLDCIRRLVLIDREWIPSGHGYSLYLRPTVISTHAVFGLAPPDELLLYVVTSPVGPYYPNGFEPVRLTADSDYVRAWPGGTGDRKIGGNYAPTMKPAAEARDEGYDQVLWTWGAEKQITEVGAMNVFFLMNRKEGGLELVTPPLTRGDILPGVTRRSVLELCHSWGEFNVSERNISMFELRDAVKEGRMIEAFGAGTAAVVSPISCVGFQGEDLIVNATGDVTKRIWDELTNIQYGLTKHEWSLVC